MEVRREPPELLREDIELCRDSEVLRDIANR